MEFVSYDIESNDFRRAGAASRAIKEHLKRIGADAEAIRRTMIAAYEAEMNVVIHSVGGRLEASLSDTRIDVNVVDEGPGIPDIELAMTEGFSTASAEARALGFGAGMGLPNIKRSSDRLRVTSRVGEGTRVSFTVNLRPEITCAAPAVSLYASADRCRDCRACLTACPTQALRVRDGRPMVLEHLCIDCAECIAACSTGALTVRDVLTSVDDVAARDRSALVVPPAFLAGCGPDYPPVKVFGALERLGFARAATVSPFENAVREAACDGGPAVIDGATRSDAEAPTGQMAPTGPVIVPVCPAIVNLVELRFPSLVGSLAPFASPWEAVGVSGGALPLACVVSCPAQRSTLAEERRSSDPGCEISPIECLLPETLRQPVMKELTGTEDSGSGAVDGTAPTREDLPAAGVVSADRPLEAETATVVHRTDRAVRGGDGEGTFVVTGIRHVMAILEEIENGLLEDVAVLEAYACEGGCFGSPLLFEDHHVARRRWERGGDVVEAAAAGLGSAAAVGHMGAVPRSRPYAARPGIRLDPDMGRAIQKLGRLQTLTRSLPGRDCGACGAPTCAALAEDIVMERATVDLCPYIPCEKEDADS
jgi:anti-sigma regulatory factor (Ser/Thr protein kinase)/Na+-translocating ferredoxin:NAD+ oxidoreductase RNF subunit RnfB